MDLDYEISRDGRVASIYIPKKLNWKSGDLERVVFNWFHSLQL